MPRPCVVCSRADRQEIDALIGTGASDYEVARQFGIERVSVGRHRRQHVIKPAQDRLAIIAKDAAARRERQELAAAAASDTPSTQALVEATLGLRAQMAKLTSIEQRLERMATLAEGAGSPTGVAQLAAQQFRGIETGARLAGISGFVPPAQAAEAVATPRFAVNIVFSNAGTTESITIGAHPPGNSTHDSATSEPIRSGMALDIPSDLADEMPSLSRDRG
jgi:hypothetical protein